MRPDSGVEIGDVLHLEPEDLRLILEQQLDSNRHVRKELHTVLRTLLGFAAVTAAIIGSQFNPLSIIEPSNPPLQMGPHTLRTFYNLGYIVSIAYAFNGLFLLFSGFIYTSWILRMPPPYPLQGSRSGKALITENPSGRSTSLKDIVRKNDVILTKIHNSFNQAIIRIYASLMFLVMALVAFGLTEVESGKYLFGVIAPLGGLAVINLIEVFVDFGDDVKFLRDYEFITNSTYYKLLEYVRRFVLVILQIIVVMFLIYALILYATNSPI